MEFCIYFAIQSSFMEEKQYIEQLKDIRNLMDRSSRFVSLSGLSGVMAGIYAIIGALGVRYLLHHYAEYGKSLSGAYRPYITLESRAFLYIVFIACAVVMLSVV